MLNPKNPTQHKQLNFQSPNKMAETEGKREAERNAYQGGDELAVLAVPSSHDDSRRRV